MGTAHVYTIGVDVTMLTRANKDNRIIQHEGLWALENNCKRFTELYSYDYTFTTTIFIYLYNCLILLFFFFCPQVFDHFDRLARALCQNAFSVTLDTFSFPWLWDFVLRIYSVVGIPLVIIENWKYRNTGITVSYLTTSSSPLAYYSPEFNLLFTSIPRMKLKLQKNV